MICLTAAAARPPPAPELPRDLVAALLAAPFNESHHPATVVVPVSPLPPTRDSSTRSRSLPSAVCTESAASWVPSLVVVVAEQLHDVPGRPRRRHRRSQVRREDVKHPAALGGHLRHPDFELVELRGQ